MEKSYYTYWVLFTPKDCILKNFKCSKCGGIANNPYPYCPWCGRAIKEIKDEKETYNKRWKVYCVLKETINDPIDANRGWISFYVSAPNKSLAIIRAEEQYDSALYKMLTIEEIGE